MTSTRLPKKVALDLAGMRVLEVLLSRLGEYKDNIIIATTDCGNEGPIVEMADGMGIKSFRGSEHDVLARYYLAACEYGAKEGDTIVRITSDCPFHNSSILKGCIDKYNESKCDYLYCDIHKSYPRGFDTEVFSFDLLKEAYENAAECFQREHVTPYIKKKENLKAAKYTHKDNNSSYRLTLDTKEDYEVIKSIYEGFGNRVNITYAEIIDYLKHNPKIAEINSDVKQKSHTC
jgi:spore coat polysaccharide biosynthesis protein SpsF